MSTELNNNNPEINLLDTRHQLHPWHSMGVENSNYMVASKAEGIYIFNEDGKRFIDGPGGMWSSNIGYGRQEMADAIAQQVLTLPFSNPWSSTTEQSAILASKLAEESPGDLNNVFFTTGGSTAVDTAIRFAWFYNNLRGKNNKKQIIARQKGYHGSTFLSSSVSGKERDKSFMDMGNTRVHFLGNVNPFIRPEGMSEKTWCDEKINEFSDLVESLGAENIAAFIAEPILASGGVIVPPIGYHAKCLDICHKNDILYISDEVVTAFGRLGEFFASKKIFDIEPDIITVAKGITSGYVPLGGVLISDRLMEEIKSEKNLVGSKIDLKILDKISSKNELINLVNGEELIYKDLAIKSMKCTNSEFDDNPEIKAYIQVRDLTKKNNDKVYVFNGWIFSSSPSIAPFDHPVYDIWLVSCY